VTPLLEVRDLVKTFTRRAAPWRRPTIVRAVDGVSFSVEARETFGLVGESGSGKTTTGRCLLRLIEPSSGSCGFRGEDVFAAPPGRLRALRREMQMVFQDPYASLNPRMRAGAIVEEGLVIHGLGTAQERADRVREMFELVGLDPSMRDRFPHAFSGGQRQRIGLARALAIGPSLVIADEPVSALDVSIQAQIVNLFMDLRDRLDLTLIFVAHDLRLVRHLCGRVAVMYRGRIVELGPTEAVFGGAAHPYTRALLSAAPDPREGLGASRVVFDPSTTDLSAPLREIAPGHLAAIP
jgi:ABC-type oligopeptide transport system ATPase subunit